jgi:hypothetical protein
VSSRFSRRSLPYRFDITVADFLSKRKGRDVELKPARDVQDVTATVAARIVKELASIIIRPGAVA